jgi:hypothetical protein
VHILNFSGKFLELSNAFKELDEAILKIMPSQNNSSTFYAQKSQKTRHDEKIHRF